MDIIKKKQKLPETSYQSPYMFPDIFGNIFCSEIYRLGTFVLIPNGFRFIQKVAKIYGVMIIPYFNFHFLTLCVPIPDEERKLTSIFIFTLLCGGSKGFMKALKAFLKCMGREGLMAKFMKEKENY